MNKRQVPSSATAAAAVDDAPGILTLSGAATSGSEGGGSGPLSAVGHRGRHGRPQSTTGRGERTLALHCSPRPIYVHTFQGDSLPCQRCHCLGVLGCSALCM